VKKLGKAHEVCSLQKMELPFNELPLPMELLSLYSSTENHHYPGKYNENVSSGPQIVALEEEEVNQGLLSNIELLNLEDQG